MIFYFLELKCYNKNSIQLTEIVRI